MEALISHKSKAPTSSRNTNDTVFDRIYKFYYDKKKNIKLTPEEDAIRERWGVAWSTLCGMHTRREAVKILIEKFSISQSMAYDDLKNAEALFPVGSSKDAKRALSEEWILWAMKKARESNDLDLVDSLIGKFNKLHGLENHDANNAEVVKNFMPVQINIVATTKELEALANKLQEELTNDVDFKEVDEKD